MNTSRNFLFAFVVLLPLSSTRGGTPYQVPAGTKGNHLILTVANESKTNASDNVVIHLNGTHPSLSFTSTGRTVKRLAPGQTAEFTFTFDVSREADLGRTDSLLFEVTDREGASWIKTILISYTGPQEYRLGQNFPNPFNPTTWIDYDIPVRSQVSIVLYDILGREVQQLVEGLQETGLHEVRLNGQGLASGTYFYRMKAEPVAGGKGYTAVKKLTILK